MTTTITLECKKICLFRCLASVALSVGMQFMLLTVFLLFVNFHILHPIRWIAGSFGLMLSFYTWLSIMPLISAVVIYGILLGNSHLAVRKYYTSRFQWLLGTVLRKGTFLLVHVVVGFLTSWLYARFLHDDYKYLFIKCYGTDCINSRYTFLIFTGIATGCYHFFNENLFQEAEVEFSVIQEVKLVRIRSLLYLTLYKSLVKSVLPTIVYALTYWIIGGMLNKRLANIFYVETETSLESLFSIVSSFRLLFYSWVLASQIFSNMHMMQRFFSIMLSEEINFPVEKNPVLAEANAEVTLVEALSLTQVPVVQKLAALDIYNISSTKVSARRQEIFALSVPGGHPYNWSQLSGQCLAIINAFTEELALSVKNISTMKTTNLFNIVKPSATDAAEKILLRQYNKTYGIRQMMAESSSNTSNNLPRKVSNTSQRIHEAFDKFSYQLEYSLRTAFRTIPGLFYMFGEPDGAKTLYLLSNSQTIVWLTQGLAGVCAVSLIEDKYGVVQCALPQIIKALLVLKSELEKLNNVNLNGTKFDRNLITLKNAVKRSLYKICTTFGEYMRDLIEDADDLRRLQCFLSYQET